LNFAVGGGLGHELRSSMRAGSVEIIWAPESRGNQP
jgi:hypothetical protein